MNRQELIEAVTEAIKANADASKNAAAHIQASTQAYEYAQAAKYLAEALTTLGLRNP